MPILPNHATRRTGGWLDLTLPDEDLHSIRSAKLAWRTKRPGVVKKIIITFHYEKIIYFLPTSLSRLASRASANFITVFDLGVFNTVLFQVAS